MADGAPVSGDSSCQYPAISIAGIFREAMKLPFRNGKLMLQVLLLISTPFSLLVLLHSFIAGPLLQKLEDGYETSSINQKDEITLVGIEIPFVFTFSIVSLFGTTITISASVLTLQGKTLTLKELMIWALPKWKQPFITWVFLSSLAIVYVICSLILSRLFALVSSYTSGWMVIILVGPFYPYFASISTLSMVASIVEDDSQGPKAIRNALKLIKGKRLHGFCLMLILLLSSIPIYVLFYVTSMDDDDELGLITWFVFMVVAALMFCFNNFFGFVVCSVFYFECKKNRGEKTEIQFGIGYCSVPSTSS